MVGNIIAFIVVLLVNPSWAITALLLVSPSIIVNVPSIVGAVLMYVTLPEARHPKLPA